MGFGLGGFGGVGGLLGGIGGNPGIPGSTTGDTPLTIGTVTFLDEEHPDNLDLELEQSLAVIQNIGGSRTIQALGPNPKDVTWTGHLFQTAQQVGDPNNIETRLGELKAMLVAATPVPLTYLDQSYMVVIRSLISKYESSVMAKYEIKISILTDSSAQYTQTAPPGLNSQLGGLSAAAQIEINNLDAIDSIGTAPILIAFDLLFAALELAGIAGL